MQNDDFITNPRWRTDAISKIVTIECNIGPTVLCEFLFFVLRPTYTLDAWTDLDVQWLRTHGITRRCGRHLWVRIL